MMHTRTKPPKAVLFDIGGVCVSSPKMLTDLDVVIIVLTRPQVLSPLEAIADYETKNGIPPNWINYAISHSAPNGTWHRLERGEIPIDEQFFKSFQADLQNEQVWRQHHLDFKKGKKKLKDAINPTQLGDPVSLKAETQDSSPTDDDRGAQPVSRAGKAPSTSTQATEKPTLSKLAKDTTIGDPVSLEAEEVVISSRSKDTAEFTSSQTPSTNKDVKDTPATSIPSPISKLSPPPIPPIDASVLFWSMMTHARTTDPYIFPALQRLSLSKRFILGALTNNVTFPQGHPFNDPLTPDLRALFDVYITSATVGLRKPQPEIYDLALSELDKFARQRHEERAGWPQGVEAADVLFLDDIGENLKAARSRGMRTLRVRAGQTRGAVEELERVLEMELGAGRGKGRREKL